MLKKVIIIGCIIIVISIAAIGGRFLFITQKYRNIVANIKINDINLSNMEDGVYRGSFNAIMVAADVTVTVENNKIKDITIKEHKNKKGEVAEIITERVIASQTLKVDTVSGATNSSKIILKAIDNALNE